MDQPGADKEETLLQLQKRLDSRCVDFSDLENFDERLAETDEELLEQFFETGKIRLEHIKKADSRIESFFHVILAQL